jgi:hypothetical protein
MGQRVKKDERRRRRLKDVKTNCEVCVFRKKRTCPYLEKLSNCHLFKKFGRATGGNLLNEN